MSDPWYERFKEYPELYDQMNEVHGRAENEHAAEDAYAEAHARPDLVKELLRIKREEADDLTAAEGSLVIVLELLGDPMLSRIVGYHLIQKEPT